MPGTGTGILFVDPQEVLADEPVAPEKVDKNVYKTEVMKQDDIQNPQLFEDRVAYGGWPLDDHPPEGMNSTHGDPWPVFLK